MIDAHLLAIQLLCEGTDNYDKSRAMLTVKEEQALTIYLGRIESVLLSAPSPNSADSDSDADSPLSTHTELQGDDIEDDDEGPDFLRGVKSLLQDWEEESAEVFNYVMNIAEEPSAPATISKGQLNPAARPFVPGRKRQELAIPTFTPPELMAFQPVPHSGWFQYFRDGIEQEDIVEANIDALGVVTAFRLWPIHEIESLVSEFVSRSYTDNTPLIQRGKSSLSYFARSIQLRFNDMKVKTPTGGDASIAYSKVFSEVLNQEMQSHFPNVIDIAQRTPDLMNKGLYGLPHLMGRMYSLGVISTTVVQTTLEHLLDSRPVYQHIAAIITLVRASGGSMIWYETNPGSIVTFSERFRELVICARANLCNTLLSMNYDASCWRVDPVRQLNTLTTNFLDDLVNWREDLGILEGNSLAYM